MAICVIHAYTTFFFFLMNSILKMSPKVQLFWFSKLALNEINV